MSTLQYSNTHLVIGLFQALPPAFLLTILATGDRTPAAIAGVEPPCLATLRTSFGLFMETLVETVIPVLRSAKFKDCLVQKSIAEFPFHDKLGLPHILSTARPASLLMP
jgi:hypothetical protein